MTRYLIQIPALVALLMALSGHPAAAQTSALQNGGFETGDLTGWTSSGINDGFATVVMQGTCYSANETRGIVFSGSFAGLVRSSGPAPLDSVGILTSDPFVAGAEIRFKALSENRDGAPAANPVSFEVRLLDSSSNVLLSQAQATNVVTLADSPDSCGGNSEQRSGSFSSHVINTAPFRGQIVRLEFRQHTNVPGEGFFTLVDEVQVIADRDGDGVPDDEDGCPDSDLSPTVLVDGCDSGVPNTMVSTGCTIADLIAQCAKGASNHGQFVSCVSQLTNDLKNAGTITGQQKAAIQSCAAQADVRGINPLRNPSNKHYYLAVSVPGSLSWDAASAAARALTFKGAQGHLATITSAAENQFLVASFPEAITGGYWLGGFQPPGIVDPAAGWQWVTGEPFSYTNWGPGEPNDFFGFDSENRLQLVPSGGGQWNDAPAGGNPGYGTEGYLVEFDTGP